MINLNDSSFDAKEGVAIFNNGTAGIVENVSMGVSKKKPEDKEGSPDYKVLFTDNAGASCNMSFWYVTKATDYATIDEQVQKQGKVLKHLVHALYGADYQLPSFQTAQQMLDGCMKLVREGLASNPKMRLFANYGTNTSPKKYIQPRSWVPFVEPMTVAIENTRLKVGTLDALEGIKQDNFGAATSPGAASVAPVGDDW